MEKTGDRQVTNRGGARHRRYGRGAIAGLLLSLAPPLAAGQSMPSPTPEAEPTALGAVSFDDSNRQVNVPVMIQGQGPYWFIIDTGASGGGAIDRSLVQSLGLPLGEEVEVGDGSGANNRREAVVEPSNITLGGLNLGPIELLVGDYRRPLRSAGEDRLGILGLSAFEKVSLTIDYPRQTVEVGINPVLRDRSEHDVSIPLDALDFVVPVRIGNLVLSAVVDTGSTSGLDLPSRLLDQMVTRHTPKVVGTARTRMNSYDILSAVPTEPVWIAEHRFDKLPIYFNGHHDVPILGYAVLRGFRVVLELRRSRGRLELTATSGELAGDFGSTSSARVIGPLLVNSGEGSLEILRSGSGSPAVILESGFSDTYEYWAAVEALVAPHHTVVRYNRAGFGRSKLKGKARTAEQIALELHEALTNAGVDPPYLLVGHSAGGMYIRVFGHRFPGEVAGMVLVDPAPEAFYAELARDDPGLWQALIAELEQAPPGARAQMEANPTTVEQVSNAWPLPKVPVAVISATAEEPPLFTAARRKAMTQAHRALVGRIPGARLVEAHGCKHNVPGDCPDLVASVILSLGDSPPVTAGSSQSQPRDD